MAGTYVVTHIAVEECDGLVEQTGIARAEDSTVSSTHCDFIFSTAHSIAL